LHQRDNQNKNYFFNLFLRKKPSTVVKWIHNVA